MGFVLFCYFLVRYREFGILRGGMFVEWEGNRYLWLKEVVFGFS